MATGYPDFSTSPIYTKHLSMQQLYNHHPIIPSGYDYDIFTLNELAIIMPSTIEFSNVKSVDTVNIKITLDTYQWFYSTIYGLMYDNYIGDSYRPIYLSRYDDVDLGYVLNITPLLQFNQSMVINVSNGTTDDIYLNGNLFYFPYVQQAVD